MIFKKNFYIIINKIMADFSEFFNVLHNGFLEITDEIIGKMDINDTNQSIDLFMELFDSFPKTLKCEEQLTTTITLINLVAKFTTHQKELKTNNNIQIDDYSYETQNSLKKLLSEKFHILHNLLIYSHVPGSSIDKIQKSIIEIQSIVIHIKNFENVKLSFCINTEKLKLIREKYPTEVDDFFEIYKLF